MELNNGTIMITPEGGIAYRRVNKTGSASVKGHVVTPSSTTDNAVENIVVDVPDAIAVTYESGIADGELCWYVFTGITDVYFIGNTVRGHVARGFLTADVGYVAGQALSEALPTAPFGVDKHFYEIGHVMESKTLPTGGLAKTNLHFN
jgi:hypothetical protein